MGLAEVDAGIKAGDPAAALEAALEAWEECRHERIAAVIDELSSRCASTRVRPTGSSLGVKQRHWLLMIANDDPADVAHLLATLSEVRQRNSFEARLRGLADRTDPRIAAAMCTMLANPPIPGASGVRSIGLALEMIVEIADPRSIAMLDRVAESIGVAGGQVAIREVRTRLPDVHERLMIRLGTLNRELSAADAKTLVAIEQRLASTSTKSTADSVAELFAAVYAHPADETARSVLADALQERGDPRGELIALQLRRRPGESRSRRETDLLRHAREWLGPIAPAVVPTDIVFERGFLVKCAVDIEHLPTGQRLAQCPEWATVRELEIKTWPAWQELLKRMPMLRVVSGVNAIPSHPTLEEVTIASLEDLASSCAAVAPSLHKVVFTSLRHHPTEMRPLWSAFGRQLRSLVLHVGDLLAWVAEAAVLQVPSIELSSWQSRWKLMLFDRVVTATHWMSFASAELDAELATILRAVPNPGSWHIKVASPHKRSGDLVPLLQRFASCSL